MFTMLPQQESFFLCSSHVDIPIVLQREHNIARTHCVLVLVNGVLEEGQYAVCGLRPLSIIPWMLLALLGLSEVVVRRCVSCLLHWICAGHSSCADLRGAFAAFEAAVDVLQTPMCTYLVQVLCITCHLDDRATGRQSSYTGRSQVTCAVKFDCACDSSSRSPTLTIYSVQH